ncbi:MAG: VWA domain-containing protein [Planctomycetes bacterium]|nr:VWA domain-containing protein [Planctomycetota bacterium]
MAALIGNHELYLGQPWWLLGMGMILPLIAWAWKNLQTLSPVRRTLILCLRALSLVLLILMLARLTYATINDELTVIAVLDRSQSISEALSQASLDYLAQALETKPPQDQFALVDCAERASIAELPSVGKEVRRRNTTLQGLETNLAAGVQMAMAIAPPNTGTRIVLISEGNQTAGDLREAARIAASNRVPIDVLPLRYRYEEEVLFKRLSAPSKARSHQTVPLRFVLESTRQSRGTLYLNLNDKPVDLDPDSPQIGVAVQLKPGTNVHTLSIPLGARGVHEFEARFVPDDEHQDQVWQNNRASAMTFVAGPGHCLVVDTDGQTGGRLVELLEASDIESRHILTHEFPQMLSQLMDVDAIILANTDSSQFSFAQQELISRYVTELGGGLVMVGGDRSFGAGGWIGSPLADVLPVDMDPPQKKQMPKGALVLVMHSCEMPQGNYWGQQVAVAAVNTLSRRDLVGILAYDWAGLDNWVHPLSEVGDKSAVVSAIKQMQMGDMPSFVPHLTAALTALSACDAAQKHVILISDGDPVPPTRQLLNQIKAAGITCTGVAVFPHSSNDVNSLLRIAQLTGGRFYNVQNPNQLPQIFIKEAQEVKRSLVLEETFVPQVTFGLSEIIKGLPLPLPALDGYVVTAPKGGLAQMVLASPEGDPILAATQAGLGRSVAFTSSMDSRWAAAWLAWPPMERFLEQMIRWVGKPALASDCEIMVDVQGRHMEVHVEAIDSEGQFQGLAELQCKIIGPDLSIDSMSLDQVGSGQYRGQFEAGQGGSYIINLQYRRQGPDSAVQTMQMAVTVPFAPEFADLQDNAALLVEISEISGGRVLVEDPNRANLFDHAGVVFPRTTRSLLPYLLKLWLLVFLLDCAVRRVVLDVKGMRRKVLAWARRSQAPTREEQAMSHLRSRQKGLRERLKGPSRRVKVAAQRYEGQADAGVTLPMAKVDPVQAPPRPVKPAEKEAEAPVSPAAPSAHIEQLLKAKRRAKRDNRD